MGSPPSLPCLYVVAPSAPHPDPPAPPAHQARRPASYQRRRTAPPERACPVRLRRTTAGTPGHYAIGASGPPHRQSTSTPGRSAAAAPPHRLHPPHCRAPSRSPSAPLLPLPYARGRGCGGGSWGRYPPRNWRRTPLGLHAARLNSLTGGSHHSALPLHRLTDGWMRIRLGVTLRAPEIVPICLS